MAVHRDPAFDLRELRLRLNGFGATQGGPSLNNKE